MPAYRLQTVLEIRERAEEAAKQAFSQAMQQLVKEKAEQKRLEDDLERRKAERKQKVLAYLQEVMAKGTGAGGLSMMNRFEERLKEEEAKVALEIERQKEVVKVALQLVETRRQEMAAAATDRKAIDKHKDNWKKQIKHERDQREEINQEEIGNALHLARQRK